MFKDIFNSVKEVAYGFRLDEALTAAEISRMQKEVTTAEVMPMTFDQTVEGWLARLEFWGKPEYHHHDPEFGIKRNISKKQFLEKLADDQLLKMVGKWRIEKLDVNKVMWYRDYVGMNSKKYREKLTVIVQLKPELRRALR